MNNITTEQWRLHLISQCSCEAEVYELWHDRRYKGATEREALEAKLESFYT